MSTLIADAYKLASPDWINLRTGVPVPPDHGPPGATETLFGAFAGEPSLGSSTTKAQDRARTCASFGVAQLPSERLFPTVGVGGGVFPTAPTPTGNFCISFDHYPPSTIVSDTTWQNALEAYVGALPATEKYWLVLNHEVDVASKGVPGPDQVAGYKIFADIIHANRNNADVKTATILTAFSLRASLPNPNTDWEAWYAGDNYVDVIGFDSYWRPSGEFTNIDACFGKPLRAAQRHGKQLIIGETSIGAQGHGGFYQDGVTPIPDSFYTSWLPQLVAKLTDPDVVSVHWFDAVKSEGSSGGAYANWTFDQDGFNHLTARGTFAAACQNSVQYA